MEWFTLMCGWVGYQGSSPDHETLNKASCALKHRGPDDQGVWFDNTSGVGLAHRRLSIIDIEGGRQPMSRGDATLVYNGEIYNYRELRDELRSCGRNFTTDSDTEVLLQAYREWGVDCLQRFRGMFSFALWDKDQKQMFLARDRLGQKPLFYSSEKDHFIAGSEIQGLLEFPEVNRKVDVDVLPLYLRLKYIPSPRSGFKDIRKLPPAHYMIIKKRTVQTRERYWNPDFDPDPDNDYQTFQRRLRKTMRHATRLRLRSDVPLGLFLSGGLDSSVVLSQMSRISDKPVKTFTVGFDYAKYDEVDHARDVAEYYQTDHHEFRIQASLEELLPRLVRHYGEPFADPSAVPTYYVAQQAREHVTVALTGDGGDEAFGGYKRYRKMLQRQIMDRWLPSFFRDMAGQLWGRLSQWHPKEKNRRSGTRFAKTAVASPAHRNAIFASCFAEEDLKRLWNEPLRLDPSVATSYFEDIYDEYDLLTSHAQKTMAVDARTHLPEALLVKVDVASMMNSLECRSPFLDHEVFELAASMPAEYKIDLKDRKKILASTFESELPPSVLTRKKKGFSVPCSDWFRGRLRDYAKNVLLAEDQSFFELFNRTYLQEILERHLDEEADYGIQLWSLLMMKLWWSYMNVKP